MSKYKKIAFLFPGQGAQYPGMGKDFVESYAVARETFEEANDILGRDLCSVIINGPAETLIQTRNSQAGIYVTSIAILRVLKQLFPNLSPSITSGLSLGEYSAATAAGCIDFSTGLPLVQKRGELMNEACQQTEGTMAVILGLDAEVVEKIVSDVDLPQDLWAANFNCPGQVVISGTQKGIDAGIAAAKQSGAKRALPLQVHGAFHSGLMQYAEDRLVEWVEKMPIDLNGASLVMNVTGKTADNKAEIHQNLIRQVTSPVRWEQGIRHMTNQGVDLFIEMGPGKTLAGFNKRIKVPVPTLSVEKVDDLKVIETELTNG